METKQLGYIIEPNAIYTLQDVAKILGLSERTLGKLCEDAKIHRIRFGNKSRFLGEGLLQDLRIMQGC